MKEKIGFIILCAILLAAAGVSQAEMVTTSKDQKKISLTIYNSDLALVRDVRQISLPVGEHVLAFKEISSKIMPETALIKAENIQVIEQNFEFDLLSPNTLLKKYVGKDVTVSRTNPKTGEEKQFQAKVLSMADGLVYKVGNQIETRLDGRLIFPDVPPNLREKPTLTMLMNVEKDGSRPFELSYLTRGLSWKADYVAELNPAEDRLDLKGWVTLTNYSGAGYDKALLQLVAGDVNQVRHRAPVPLEAERRLPRIAQAKSASVAQETLFEYHLYTIGRPTTIKNNQSKQIALLEEDGGICVKRLVLEPMPSRFYWNRSGQVYKKKSVGVYLWFKNDKESNFGLPKPAGIIRVYKKDKSGFTQFLGEDRISHTPENEEIEIKMGDAFDVTADRKQTQFSFVASPDKNRRIYENEFEIKLKNAKDKDIIVKIMEHIPGEWKILRESHPHEKEDASTIFWQVKIPAKSEKILTFRVRTKV